jgi:HEAT repeat protein
MKALAMILLMSLSDDKEVEEAIQKFKSTMKSPELAARVGAVTEVGRLQNIRVMKVLASCLTTDDKLVRIAAAKSLGGYQEKKPLATALLTEGLDPNAKEPDVLIEIISAMKTLHEESSLSAAYRHLDDKNTKVAEAAIGLTGVVRSKNSIDLLVRLMKKLLSSGEGYSSGDGSLDVPADEALRERARRLESAASKALQSITGEKWSNAQEWGAWWKSNASTFKVKD